MANPKTLPDCVISIAGPKAQEQPHSGWPLNIPGKLHKNPLYQILYLSRQTDVKTGLAEDLVEILPFWAFTGIQSQSRTPRGKRTITGSFQNLQLHFMVNIDEMGQIKN